MGKMKGRRRVKHDPVGVRPKVKSLEKLETDGALPDPTGSAFVQTILGQLASQVMEERDSGLNSLSLACLKSTYLMEIGKSDIIKTVAPLLLDSAVSVRNFAAGALRNMSCVSPEFCELMVKQDVLTPLTVLLKQTYKDWIPPSKEKNKNQATKIDSTTDTLVQAVALLWNLCENCSTALRTFNGEQLESNLCKYLDSEVFGIKLAVAVAQCLYTATEDNPEALSPPLKLQLNKVLTLPDSDPDTLYLKTLVVGISLNLTNGEPTNMLPILHQTLDLNHIDYVNKFSSEVPLNNQLDQEDLAKLIHLETQSGHVLNVLCCQTLALEIVSNIMCAEDDEEDNSEEEVDDRMDCDDGGSGVEMEQNSQNPSGMVDLLPKVVSKIRSLPVNVHQILIENPEFGQKVVAHVTRQRCTALICLQNLVEALPLKDIEQRVNLEEVWTGLGTLLVELDPTTTTGLDLIEAVTSAMRAIMQSWTKAKKPLGVDIATSSFQQLTQVFSKIEVGKVRVNVVKMMGGLGLVNSSLLTQVGVFLVSSLPPKIEKEGLWLVAEVLDTVFDVFGEDEQDAVVGQIGLMGKLKALQPLFKKMVRSERRSLGENRAVVQMANENLPRFILYKGQGGVS